MAAQVPLCCETLEGEKAVNSMFVHAQSPLAVSRWPPCFMHFLIKKFAVLQAMYPSLVNRSEDSVGLTRVGAIWVVVDEEEADAEGRRAVNVVEAQHCRRLIQLPCSRVLRA